MDNQKRFAMFCKAALESLRALPFMPGEDCLIVANDWHTSLIPVLLKDVYKPRGEFKDTKTALCVHNIAFQGRFWQDEFGQLGLPDSARPLFDFTDGYPKVFDEASPADESKANEVGVRAPVPHGHAPMRATRAPSLMDPTTPHTPS